MALYEKKEHPSSARHPFFLFPFPLHIILRRLLMFLFPIALCNLRLFLCSFASTDCLPCGFFFFGVLLMICTIPFLIWLRIFLPCRFKLLPGFFLPFPDTLRGILRIKVSYIYLFIIFPVSQLPPRDNKKQGCLPSISRFIATLRKD